MSITLYRNKGAPLTTDEVDDNFDSLFPKDGTAPLEGNLTIQGSLITVTSNTLTIGDQNDTINIPGTLNTNISQSPTVDSKTFTINSSAQTKSDSDTSGIKIGSTGVINLLYNSTSDAWEATTNVTNEGVNIKAEDFLTDSGRSLINDIVDLETFTGSAGASSPDYTATNYLTTKNSLTDAVVEIDVRLKTIFDELQNVQSSTASYTEDNVVTSGESLEKGVDDLDIHSKFTITKFEKSSISIEAVSGTEYILSPSSQETLDVTLPDTKRGIVGVRMTSGDNGERIRVAGNAGDSIEDQGTDSALITQDNHSVYFIWDTNYNTWRIR